MNIEYIWVEFNSDFFLIPMNNLERNLAKVIRHNKCSKHLQNWTSIFQGNLIFSCIQGKRKLMVSRRCLAFLQHVGIKCQMTPFDMLHTAFQHSDCIIASTKKINLLK